MTQKQSDLFYTGGAGAIAVPKITAWESFTPTGGWTTNTVYTGHKRQVGSNLEMEIQISLTGAPGGDSLLSIDVPGGLNIDDSVASDTTLYSTKFGSGLILDGGSVGSREVFPVNFTTTSMRVAYESSASNTYLLTSNSAPITFASGDSVNVKIVVPIAEWSVDELVGSALNRWQKKLLNGDVTADADADLADIQFNGLEIGKTYRVSVLPYIETSVSDDNAAILGIHDGNTILRARANTSGSSLEIDQFTSSSIFTATATTLTWSGESTSANAIIRGNNTIDETWAMIEELNNYQTETTAFS